VTIAEQVGHEDPSFTLRVYAKATKRRAAARCLPPGVRSALEWAETGRIDAEEVEAGSTVVDVQTQETAS
jgi:hypothetical protein